MESMALSSCGGRRVRPAGQGVANRSLYHRQRSAITTATAAAEETQEIALPSQTLRIKLKAFDKEPVKEACNKITDTATRTGAHFAGPVMLPTHIRRYCVLRSPFVHKDAKDHYEIRTHSRLIDIKNPSAATVDSLMSLDLPAGVSVSVQL